MSDIESAFLRFEEDEPLCSAAATAAERTLTSRAFYAGAEHDAKTNRKLSERIEDLESDIELLRGQLEHASFDLKQWLESFERTLNDTKRDRGT